MTWLTVAQNVANFLTSQFGSILLAIAIFIAGARAMFHGHWGQFWSAIGGGAVMMSAAWVVTTFFGGTAG